MSATIAHKSIPKTLSFCKTGVLLNKNKSIIKTTPTLTIKKSTTKAFFFVKLGFTIEARFIWDSLIKSNNTTNIVRAIVKKNNPAK